MNPPFCSKFLLQPFPPLQRVLGVFAPCVKGGGSWVPPSITARLPWGSHPVVFGSSGDLRCSLVEETPW